MREPDAFIATASKRKRNNEHGENVLEFHVAAGCLGYKSFFYPFRFYQSKCFEKASYSCCYVVEPLGQLAI
jgi:hypothetical protein